MLTEELQQIIGFPDQTVSPSHSNESSTDLITLADIEFEEKVNNNTSIISLDMIESRRQASTVIEQSEKPLK